MSERESIHILYMEGDAGLSRLFKMNLLPLGYAVDLASNGEEGLSMVEHGSYSIVLVDYNLPVIAGMEVVRRLAVLKNAPPVVMLAGNGNEKIAVEAMKIGAVDYLVKDVALGYMELLPLVIEQVLQRGRLLREREQMHKEVGESEERYRKLVELSPDGIAVHVEGKFEFINPAGMRILGVMPGEKMLGRNVLDVIHPDYRQVFLERLDLLEKPNIELPWLEEKFLRSDGAEVDVEVTALRFIFNDSPAVQTIFRDITERKLGKQRLERMANYDSLTGLPNRSLLFERLNQLLLHAKRGKRLFALLFLDLDRLKNVNDTLGHYFGDLLLKEVAVRLTSCLRETDSVARMGGDEFVVVLAGPADRDAVALVASKIIEVINRPFTLQNREYSLGVSIGISLYPDDASAGELLVVKADTAMYRAKELGRNNYQFCSCNEGSVAHQGGN